MDRRVGPPARLGAEHGGNRVNHGTVRRAALAGGGRIFVPIKFCRQCGRDYYHVLRRDNRLLPHPIGIDSSSDDESQHPGYLMLTPIANY